MYLPRCNFSSNRRDPAMATTTSMRGLNTDTNSGPRIRTHVMMKVTINPEAKVP